MEPAVLALKKKYKDKIEFIIVNTRTPEGSELAVQYRVNYIPAFFLINQEGNITFAEEGPQPQEKLDREIANIVLKK